MKKAGLNQRELAARLKIREATVTGWKKGAIPETKYLSALAEILHVSMEWLLNGKEGAEEASLRYVMDLAETLRIALDQFVEKNNITPKKE